MQGAVAYAAVINTIGAHALTDRKKMITGFKKLTDKKYMVFFSNGIRELYFLEAIDADCFFNRFSKISTLISLEQLQRIADQIDDKGLSDLYDVTSYIGHAKTSTELEDSLDVIEDMISL